ncbi:MAG TPA: OPT family oligopeptide transporter [Pirellulales bacterium]
MSIHPIDDEGEDLAFPENHPAKRDAPGTSDDDDARHWLANVYQGDRLRQLSARSIITGMLIGGVMSISNLYVGLKTGWGLGVTITACIIAYAVFRALEAVVPRFRADPFTILENNTMSSAASAAGYMASAGLVSAIPALQIITGHAMTWWEMMAWLAAVSVLGVFMAIPLKRQLINIDKLPFPEGLATAETLKSMHSAGAEALQKAKALLAAALFGAGIKFWKEGLPPLAGWLGRKLSRPDVGERLAGFALPDEIPLWPAVVHDWFPRVPSGRQLMERLNVAFEGSAVMIAVGAIMGLRVGVSLLVGAIVFYGVIGPWLLDAGIVAKPGYRGIVQWTLWPATSMLVTSGLLAFAMNWRTVLRAFSGLATIMRRDDDRADPLAAVEVPGWWFAAGTVVSGAACVYLGEVFFGIEWWMGVLAVGLTFVLSLVAARATGETSITPIGAMGKITQLIYGVVAPSNIATNLMTASITAGAASHSADLLTDLKTGYLLGANPRKQTIAQLFGVLAGTLFCVPIYTLIVRPEELGGTEWPAPAAKMWEAVARLLSTGIGALPKYAIEGIIVGGLVGIALTLAESFLPKQYRAWIPSATALGIAGVVPAANSISMFLGALAAWILTQAKPGWSAKYIIPLSSGIIAGESLMGVAIIIWLQGPQLIHEMLRMGG